MEKIHNEELNDLYSSTNIMQVIKSRRIRWAKHVARMGVSRDVYRVLVGKPDGKNHLEDLGVNGNIKKDLQKVGWRASAGLSWLKIGTGGGHL
jgi:hypothetical protein